MAIILAFIISWFLVKLGIFRPPRSGTLNCGIFGFSGPRPVDITKLKWLAVENQSRGVDSTGVYGNQIFKERGPAKEVILMPGFVAAVKGAHTVQGHARQASVGYDVTKLNAHPFHYGIKGDPDDSIVWAAEVVGAHNGFVIPDLVKNHEEAFGFKKTFTVDSQLIFAALAKTGDVNSISQIEGGMALSFQILSDNPNKLYLYKRQETRPLHIGEAADGIYYSSLEEPLKFIGCKNIWECAPNMLYTFENGELVDIYRMPDPILKSLAVNVSRGTWRQGIPHAELSALPKNVTSTDTHSAFSGGHSKHNYGFSGGNNRGFTSNTDTIKTRVASEYKGKDSLDSKFNMLIADLSREINKYDPISIDTDKIVTTDREHLSSCALVVHIKNAATSKGLPAWSVLADGDPSLAGLTSGNGTTLIKIPVEKCKQDIKFFAYAPVEEYGPFEFIITPQAARVMEVTLSIPFLKKGRKKTEVPEIDTRPDNSEVCSGPRQISCGISVSEDEPAKLYVLGKGDDSRLLSQNTSQISGGRSKQQTYGFLDESNPYATVIPETDAQLAVGPKLTERIKNTLPKLEDKARQVMIELALQSEAYGTYKHYRDMPLAITKWATEMPERYEWMGYYERNHYNALKVSELIMDATRLMERDKFIQQTWFPFWVYIELLLRDFFCDYTRHSFPNINKLAQATFYPSAGIIAGVVNGSKKKVRTVFP